MNTFKRLGRAIDKVFDLVSRLLEVISILAMVGIMLMLVTQTVLQWFKISLLWSDEVVSVMNIWLVFMAAAVVAHEHKHVQVDFITSKLPRKVQAVLEIIIMLVCIYACYTICRGGITYLQRTKNIKTNILRLPQVTMYTAPLISLVLMILIYARDIIKHVIQLFCKADARKGEAA